MSQYDTGYADGRYDGLEKGYDTGYADGRYDGLEKGYANGYADGRCAGLDKGYDDALEKSYDDGYADGVREGKAEGVAEGRSRGPSVRVERLSGGLWRASLDDQPHVYEDSAVSAHDAVGLVVARVGTVTIRRGGA